MPRCSKWLRLIWKSMLSKCKMENMRVRFSSIHGCRTDVVSSCRIRQVLSMKAGERKVSVMATGGSLNALEWSTRASGKITYLMERAPLHTLMNLSSRVASREQREKAGVSWWWGVYVVLYRSLKSAQLEEDLLRVLLEWLDEWILHNTYVSKIRMTDSVGMMVITRSESTSRMNRLRP